MGELRSKAAGPRRLSAPRHCACLQAPHVQMTLSGQRFHLSSLPPREADSGLSLPHVRKCSVQPAGSQSTGRELWRVSRAAFSPAEAAPISGLVMEAPCGSRTGLRARGGREGDSRDRTMRRVWGGGGEDPRAGVGGIHSQVDTYGNRKAGRRRRRKRGKERQRQGKGQWLWRAIGSQEGTVLCQGEGWGWYSVPCSCQGCPWEQHPQQECP